LREARWVALALKTSYFIGVLCPYKEYVQQIAEKALYFSGVGRKT
jgi:hypothetical protein